MWPRRPEAQPRRRSAAAKKQSASSRKTSSKAQSVAAEETETPDEDADDEPDDSVIEADGQVVGEPDSRRSKKAPKKNDRALARVDNLQVYMREVQRHALLSPEEEHELAVHYTKSEDVQAAAKLVTANLRLVVKIAYEYRRAYRT